MYIVPNLEDYSPAALDRAVADLFAALSAETAALHSDSDWKEFRDRWLARKNGLLTQVNDTWLKAAPKEAKREVGQRVNELKSRAEAAIEGAHEKIHASSSDAKLAVERLDITLPGVARPIGTKHPVLRAMKRLSRARTKRSTRHRRTRSSPSNASTSRFLEWRVPLGPSIRCCARWTRSS